MIDLHQGDALTVLRTLESESVNCVICSPPYWGLRDYGTPPVVFGGDSECDHEWTAHVKPAANGLVNNEMQGETLSVTSATRKPTTSAYCAKCGAWRGQLGLEPTFAEFLAHMVEIFEECRRVLRKDGTCWVNMGDSYSSGGGSDPTGSSDGATGRGERGKRYQGNLQSKNLVGQPWRLAFALQDAGWILRSDIIWHKPNPMPESVTDRPTRAHEYVFLLVKSKKYWYDADAIRTVPSPETKQLSHDTMDYKRRDKYKTPDGWDTGEGAHGTIHRNGREKGLTASERFGGPNSGFRRKECPNNAQPSEKPVEGRYEGFQGANARTVWTIATQGYPDAHFATFPEELPKRCILAGCPEGGTVLDIFAGSGTTLAVAIRLGRKAIGIELSAEYIELARKRIAAETPSLFAGAPE